MDPFTITSPCPDKSPTAEDTAHEYCIAQAQSHFKNGKQDYLIDGNSHEKLLYQDVDPKSKRIASYFYKNGLRKGDVVVYTTSYQIHQIPLMIGVWRANGVIRSLYVDESEDTILQKLQESNCRWIFCDSENSERFGNAGKKCAWPVEIVICEGKLEGFVNMEDLYNDDGNQCPKTEVSGEDLALILPTSGTTGPSKGAAISHRSTIARIQNWGLMPYSRNKPNIMASKGTHVSGIFPFCILINGVVGIVLPQVDKYILIKTVDKYKPGFVFAFPSFLLALGSLDSGGYDMTSIDTILTGGSPVTTEMYKAYLKIGSVKSVLVLYGLTECPNVCANVDFRDNQDVTYRDCPMSSIGKPYPNGMIQIRDLETLEPVGPNIKGEICVKCDNLFQGYYKYPEGTKNAFIDGWFRTGDVGETDENGFVFIVDRSKDIFKYFHNHISPTELENVINKHPEVEEACVVPIPDEGGEVPRAFVVLKNPQGCDKNTISQEIKQFANDNLASYKRLRGGLYIVDDFPKGKTGKVTRSLVAQMELPQNFKHTIK